MTDQDIKSIIRRIEKLEKAVFGGGADAGASSFAGQEKFSGATGGIRFLASKGFFNSKRSLGEVKDSLAEKGYHYSVQAVQIALSRLSKSGAILVTLREGGRKKYAKRK